MQPSPTWEPHIRTVWINTQCIADFKYTLTPLTAALMVFSELCVFVLSYSFFSFKGNTVLAVIIFGKIRE